MRLKLFFVLCSGLLFFTVIQAQVPNAGFENWTAGSPDQWFTSNNVGIGNITQSSVSHSGASALKGEVIDYFTIPYPPYIWSFDQNDLGFPVSQRYQYLSGYFQLYPQGGDVIEVTIFMYKDSVGVGGGSQTINLATSTYQQFNTEIFYYDELAVPNQCWIYIGLFDTTSDNANVGSYYLLDDLSLSGTATGIRTSNSNIPQNFEVEQNYPNPFNPSTTINFSLPFEGPTTLIVYNSVGQKVATLIDKNMQPGNYNYNFNAVDLPSGIYFAQVKNSVNIKTIKMALVK